MLSFEIFHPAISLGQTFCVSAYGPSTWKGAVAFGEVRPDSEECEAWRPAVEEAISSPWEAYLQPAWRAE